MAYAKAIGVVAYFFVATVWLPNLILGIGAIETASTFVRDGLTSLVWAVALGGGIVGLRVAQRRGLI